MPISSFFGGIPRLAGQKVDEFFTNYLRNTTSDQEILNFYGEGNIVGRKGISATDKELLDSVEASGKLNYSPLRPDTGRQNFAVGGIDQEIKYDYKTKDMPGVINPATGRPWQMTFGVLPKDFGSGSLTPAAKQFLVDFRVPVNAGNDYSFATGPNLLDRIETETKDLKRNDPYHGKRPERLQEDIDVIQKQSDRIGDYSGQPQTPRTWQERGYITEKPTGFKENVLNEFKNRIFKTQGSFGGVSTLTPVEQVSASNPNWRSDIYQREGLAGPLSDQGFSSGYGGGSKDVQRFTTGKERILPLQPYTEFFQRLDSTSPSVLKTAPASDFTPFQKAVGTRNYLIGKNILEGRGNLGEGFRGATRGLATGAALGALSPEVSQALVQGDYKEAAGLTARDAFIGAGTNLAAKGVSRGLQRAVPQFAARVLPAIGSTANVAIPAAVGAGLFMQGQQGSPLNRLVNAASNTPIGLKVNPETDVGRMAGRAISNEAQAWMTRNTPASPHSTYTGPTPAIKPRMATAILNGKPIQVPYGSVAGERKVGRPWWDVAGSTLQGAANSLNLGSIIGR